METLPTLTFGSAVGRSAKSGAETASSLQPALLAPLGEKERRELLAVCRVRRFKAGEVLFHEGDPGHSVFFLQSGKVKILQDAADGSETILHIAGPGEWVGDLALVDDGPRSATALASTRVEALALTREDFRALIARHPAVAQVLLSHLAGMVRRLNEQLHAALSLDATARIAKKLLELAHQHGTETPQGVHIGVRLTQEQLAHMAGVARSTLNKQLGWFESRGVLTLDRESIYLHRPDQLRKRAVG